MRVVSAHRAPDDMARYANSAHQRGLWVIIAGAGGAAHLPGRVASHTPLSVIGVPVESNKGSDAHVDAVAQENVKLVMAQIKERSPILAELIREGKVGLVGGMYDLESGKVKFLE